MILCICCNIPYKTIEDYAKEKNISLLEALIENGGGVGCGSCKYYLEYELKDKNNE